MAAIRDRLRKILEQDLILEFKDHNALENQEKWNATLKIIKTKIESVIDKIEDVYKSQ